MSIYDPDDDGLDDDSPYEINYSREEANEDIARMMLRQDNATEPQIVNLLLSLVPKYKEYLSVFNTSNRAKLSKLAMKLLEVKQKATKIRKSLLKIDTALDLKDRREQSVLLYDATVANYITDYDNRNFKDDPKIMTIEVRGDLEISQIDYYNLIRDAMAYTFNERKATLEKSRENKEIALEKLDKEIEEIKKKEIKIKNTPNKNEEQILSEANNLLSYIDKQLSTRLTTYLTYAKDSKLKEEIKMVAEKESFGYALKADYIHTLFKKINDGIIKLNSQEQGD